MMMNISISDIEDQVISAMYAVGITPPREGLFIDRQIHRFHIESDSPGTKNGAYCIYPEGKSYNGWPNGFFQDHKRGSEVEKWQYDVSGIDKGILNQWKDAAVSPEAIAKREKDEKVSCVCQSKSTAFDHEKVQHSCQHVIT